MNSKFIVVHNNRLFVFCFYLFNFVTILEPEKLFVVVCNYGCIQKIPNPYVDILSDADLGRRIARQLKIEASDKITVKSVIPEPKLTPVIIAAVCNMSLSGAVVGVVTALFNAASS